MLILQLIVGYVFQLVDHFALVCFLTPLSPLTRAQPLLFEKLYWYFQLASVRKMSETIWINFAQFYQCILGNFNYMPCFLWNLNNENALQCPLTHFPPFSFFQKRKTRGAGYLCFIKRSRNMLAALFFLFLWMER